MTTQDQSLTKAEEFLNFVEDEQNHSKFEQNLMFLATAISPNGAMNFDRYQFEARATAVYPYNGTRSLGAKTYCALKLAGEAGEIAEKIGKYLYRGDRLPEGQVLEEVVKKELGDVLWYVSQLAYEFGIFLTDVANTNLAKLSDRKERGVLKGSGDDR